MNKSVVLTLSIILVILLTLNGYLVIDNRKLNKELDALQQEQSVKKGTASNEESAVSNKEMAYLRDLGQVKLFFLPTKYHPAFGDKAEINTTTLSEDNKVEILDSKEEWTKISIEGWIPSWSLTNTKPTIGEVGYIDAGQKRTLKEKSFLYLIPDDNSNLFDESDMKTGQVVEILYEYKDWYYVKRFVHWDANEYPQGWIQKSHLATFEEIKPTEVMIKKGTMTYNYGSETEIGRLEKNAYGRINDVEDGWCDLSFPGAYGFRVKAEDITYDF